MSLEKVHALAGAIIATNTELKVALEDIHAKLTETTRRSEPLQTEEQLTLLGIVNASIGITRSNLLQLQSIRKEAEETEA